LKADWADAYRALGIAYLHKNNSADAITALKRANELNSADAETRNSLGWLTTIKRRCLQREQL